MLEAAARAALALCLDPRAEPGGEWHEDVATWVDARIRKIARRARGAHWAAVQELPGVTVAVGDAQARALLPGPVDDVPKVVSRLQIGGTDLPDDQPGPPPPGVPGDLGERRAGDDGGQGRGAGGARVDAGRGGPRAHRRTAVRRADRRAAAWARLCDAADRGEAVAVRDAGFTEVAPGTITTITTPG